MHTVHNVNISLIFRRASPLCMLLLEQWWWRLAIFVDRDFGQDSLISYKFQTWGARRSENLIAFHKEKLIKDTFVDNINGPIVDVSIEADVKNDVTLLDLQSVVIF